jgi:hypothetical protein
VVVTGVAEGVVLLPYPGVTVVVAGVGVSVGVGAGAGAGVGAGVGVVCEVVLDGVVCSTVELDDMPLVLATLLERHPNNASESAMGIRSVCFRVRII